MGLQKEETWTQTQREGGYVKMGKKIGVMLPQEKEGLGQSEAGRTGKNFTLELFYPEFVSGNTLISYLLVSGTVRQCIYVYLKPIYLRRR